MPPTTNSDSEDDTDYIPPTDDHDSDSPDEQDAPPETAPLPSLTEQKKHRDALWESFQASLPTPPPAPAPVKHVTIEKTYLFAGKQVRDVVEVPEDSEEAKRWPRWELVPPASEPTPVKRPVKRPRTSLPSIPKTSQVKKLTTLDKSAMDWRAHVATQSSDVQDALDANKRGGGYLEKVDFLKRVQDRREDALEASKLSKRRKT